MLDAYDTARLVGIIADLRRPSNFLLRTYFNNYIGPTGRKKIVFDVEGRNTGMAMFCSPYVEGRPVRERGFSTKEFEPAYVKPWMALDPDRPLKRRIGEDIGGEVEPEERFDAIVVANFDDLYRLCFNRIEKMAGEALVTGKNIVSGDGYETQEVDYGRKATHTKTLTSTARWGETDVSPVKDLESWNRQYTAENGYAPNRITFDPKAFDLFRDDPLYEKAVNQDYKRQTEGSKADTLMFGDEEQGYMVGALASGGATIELWVYNQSFLDENEVNQQVLPDYAVVLGSSNENAQQTQAFGTIIDPTLGYRSELIRDPYTGQRMDVAPKLWGKPNPGQVFQMVQAAPLTALTKPNAILAATVR